MALKILYVPPIHSSLLLHSFLFFSLTNFTLLLFVATPHSMQDLSFLTRDQTPHSQQWKSRVLIIGPLGKSHICFNSIKILIINLILLILKCLKLEIGLKV